MSNASPATIPGSQFDIPGVANATQWFDQYEDTVDLSFTPSASTQKQILNIQNMRRTDVVFAWEYNFTFTNTVTFGTSDVYRATYFPYNLLGSVELSIQNQYSCIDVESGIDWLIFNLVRPYRKTATVQGFNNYGNPQGSPADAPTQGWLFAGTPQSNLVVPSQFSTAGIAATTTDTVSLVLDMPAGVWFDEYYSLDVSGNLQDAIADIFVSPQYMAGTQRLIQPTIKTNPLFIIDGASDTSPYYAATGSTSTVTSSGSLNIRRQGVYGNNTTPSLPAPQPWQYQWLTNRFSISGTSKTTIQVPDDAGQCLFLYLRLWDPSAGSDGAGAPIAASAITEIQLQYSSGLTEFDGTPLELQARWLQTHDFLLPQGVYGIDLGYDELGTFSNKRALNTLNTAGIQWVINFGSATSSTAYAVLGIESLVYVV